MDQENQTSVNELFQSTEARWWRLDQGDDDVALDEVSGFLDLGFSRMGRVDMMLIV